MAGFPQSPKTESPTQAEAREARRQAMRKDARDREFAALVARAGIPERHADRKIPTDRRPRSGDEPWRPETVAHRIADGRFAGETIALVGGRGVGKTQLAVWAIKHSAWSMAQAGSEDRAAGPVYVTAAAMFRGLRQGMKDGGEEQAVAKFLRPLLLVVDALQNRGETDYEYRTLTEILDERYAANLDTILISNMTVEEFGKSVGPDIQSRMGEAGILIPCVWEPFRPEARKERSLRYVVESPELAGGKP